MTDFGEVIIDRLHPNCKLRNTNNPVRKIIDYGIGGFLENFDDTLFFENFFITEATAGYLDWFGDMFNIKRKIDENDEDYRKRIIYESLGHITADFLKDIYNVGLYVYTSDFNVNGRVLTSDNKFINSYGFIIVCTEEIKNILSKKIVVGSDVHWQIV